MFRLAHMGWRRIHPCLQHQHKIMLCSADIKNTHLKLCFKHLVRPSWYIMGYTSHTIMGRFQFYAYKHSNRAILNPARVCGLFNAHYTHTFYRNDRSCCVNLSLLKKKFQQQAENYSMHSKVNIMWTILMMCRITWCNCRFQFGAIIKNSTDIQSHECKCILQ